MESPPNVFSHGSGQQTIAALVLQAHGKLPDDYPVFAFANVGDNAEHPDTLAYHRDIAVPYAAEHDIELRELRWVDRTGKPRDLYDDVMNPDRRSVDIPVRMLGSGSPGMRNCTHKYKRQVVRRFTIDQLGASEDNPVKVAIGITIDELSRARSDSGYPEQIRTEPLIDMRLRRQDCINIIRDEGLPIPPPSACFFCPFLPLDHFRAQKATRPDLHDKTVALETRINEKRESFGKDDVFLTRALKPLPIAVGPGVQEALPFDTCDTGACFT